MTVLFYLLFINTATFLIYGIDKWKAKRNRYRISESTLLYLAVFGGSIGALLAMQLFRHKTRHKKFTVGIPAIAVLQTAFLLWLHRYLL